jgi:thiosulfate reductase cytochrome b subunit
MIENLRVTYFNINLDTIFPYAIFVILLNLIHYMVVNVMGGKHRKTHFSPEFMSQFNTDHQAAFG